jgi:undecaprenyl-diphosphatase
MQPDLATLLAAAIRWDHEIALWLNQMAGHRPAFDRFVYTLSASALLKGGLFMAFFWWQWFRHDAARTARRQLILTALAGAIVAIAAARALQIALPFRVRPLHDAALSLRPPAGVNPATLDGWSSLPSDHAVLFFALATAVWRLSRPLGGGAFLWAGVVVCLPRVYLGYHHATDILAGAVLGVLVMTLSLALLRPRLLAAPLLRWERAHATSFYCLAFLASLQLAVMFQDVRALAGDTIGLVELLREPAAQTADAP